jgi:hypothetical protein
LVDLDRTALGLATADRTWTHDLKAQSERFEVRDRTSPQR